MNRCIECGTPFSYWSQVSRCGPTITCKKCKQIHEPYETKFGLFVSIFVVSLAMMAWLVKDSGVHSPFIYILYALTSIPAVFIAIAFTPFLTTYQRATPDAATTFGLWTKRACQECRKLVPYRTLLGATLLLKSGFRCSSCFAYHTFDNSRDWRLFMLMSGIGFIYASATFSAAGLFGSALLLAALILVSAPFRSYSFENKK